MPRRIRYRKQLADKAVVSNSGFRCSYEGSTMAFSVMVIVSFCWDFSWKNSGRLVFKSNEVNMVAYCHRLFHFCSVQIHKALSCFWQWNVSLINSASIPNFTQHLKHFILEECFRTQVRLLRHLLWSSVCVHKGKRFIFPEKISLFKNSEQKFLGEIPQWWKNTSSSFSH